jgi:hypothetical protein
MLETFKNYGYMLGLSVRGLGLQSMRRLFVERRAPGWITAKDHMFICMRRLP